MNKLCHTKAFNCDCDGNDTTVYIGTMEFRFGRMIMFHMGSPSIESLHKMADKIGINRKWFQDTHGLHDHYDICKSKKILAIKYGAVEVNDRDLITKCYPKLKNINKT